MSRKHRIFTHEFPYHIVARANNRDFFSLPLPVLAQIFKEKFEHISSVYGFHLHAFTLMGNHYHLVGSASEQHNIGRTMGWLNTSVSRAVNARSGRINHVFGGRFKDSLIRNPFYYAHVLRYVFQNPVRAGICQRVEDYEFSTILQEIGEAPGIWMPTVQPITGIGEIINSLTLEERLQWFNTPLREDDLNLVRLGLRKHEFFISPNHNKKKPHWMSCSLNAPQD